ncbi:hypothetical protein KG090_00520 [Carnobacteriaceae bacterium zg-ZUI240]|nr:hypothetical protein [Carnobacteriaceae bacterium zg-ZUI240]
MKSRYELEEIIITVLLSDFSMIKTQPISPDWFFVEDFQTIISVLKDKYRELENEMDLYFECLESNPYFKMTYDIFQKYSKVGVFSKYSFDYYVKKLNLENLRDNLKKLQEDYLKHPTTEKERDMQYLLKQIEHTNTRIDAGELSGSFDELLFELNHNVPQGVKSFSRLDSTLGGGISPGNLVVIGARPSVGKSAFTINMIEKALERNENMRVDLFSLEMTKKEVLRRMVSMRTGFDSYRLKNSNKLLLDKQKEDVKKVIEHYKNKDIKIYQDSILENIISIIKARAIEKKVGEYLVAIDYLGLIKLSKKQRDRRLEIEEITRELKVLAADLQIPIILLSQLSRGVEQRNDKRPNLSDLRESGSIEQDANVVAFLFFDDKAKENSYHPSEKREIELLIRKNRDGSLADIKFNFFPKKMLFEEVLL